MPPEQLFFTGVGTGEAGSAAAPPTFGVLEVSKQASSFFNKNLTNADNDNSMNLSTKMEISQVNQPANNVQTMQYVKINTQTLVGRDTPTHTPSRYP